MGVWIAAVLIALGVARLMPAYQPVSDHFGPLTWSPAVPGEAPSPSLRWRSGGPPSDIRGAVWVKANFNLTAEQARRGGVALLLSGPFSATVSVNGRHAGDKGRPGFTPAQEIAGPIDASIPLGDAVHAGVNELEMLVSVQSAGRRPGVVLQGLSIAPLGAGPLRPLSRYVIALSQAGLLAAIAFAFLLSALRQSQDRAIAWAGAGAVSLLLALAAETARAWWDYPYSYHLLRQIIIWVALTGFGAALLEATAARAGHRSAWRLTGVVVALGVASIGIGDGIDLRIVATLVVLALATGWVSLPLARAGSSTALALLGVLGSSVVLACLNPAQYLDNGVYSLGALSLFLFAWRLPDAGSPSSAAPTEEVAENTGGEIVRIKAEGNYAEVLMADGSRVFVRQALSCFPPAESLMRVHRSHVVNLSHARRIVAATGSRYCLEMHDGARIPVSRRLVGELRRRMASVR